MLHFLCKGISVESVILKVRFQLTHLLIEQTIFNASAQIHYLVSLYCQFLKINIKNEVSSQNSYSQNNEINTKMCRVPIRTYYAYWRVHQLF